MKTEVKSTDIFSISNIEPGKTCVVTTTRGATLKLSRNKNGVLMLKLQSASNARVAFSVESENVQLVPGKPFFVTVQPAGLSSYTESHTVRIVSYAERLWRL